MLGSLQTHFWAVREYLAPVLRDSKFKESGRLTPDEFVAAGDFLVYKFPTWKWEGGEVGKKKEYLPDAKQYLVSRNVPCLRRVSQLAYGGNGDEDVEIMMSFAVEGGTSDGGEEDWVATHTSKDPSASSPAPTMEDIPDIESISEGLKSTSITTDETPHLDDIPDMDDGEDENLDGGGLIEEEDDAAFNPSSMPSSDNLLRVRTYDCSITYDKYYQTPRMWLLGYDEHKSPLPPASALEDVSADHAQKTVTIEPFPHSSLSMASVHPCKHSDVMKKMIERMDRNVVDAQRREREKNNDPSAVHSNASEGAGTKKWVLMGKKGTTAKESNEDGPEGLRVDQYLVVFLKFMSSIVPTIEVDATASL